MGPLSGTGARLAAVCVLLAVAAVSCASPAPGTSPAGPRGQGSVSGQQTLGSPSLTAPPSPERITGPGTGTAEPTTPVPKGCPSGTVAITHRPAETGTSTVCIAAGARLRLTITVEGEGGWTPLQVTPEGAATVASTTDPTGIVHAIVTPAGTVPFCLSTGTTSTTAPYTSWRLCVTLRR
jgi:hypothetical protein